MSERKDGGETDMAETPERIWANGFCCSWEIDDPKDAPKPVGYVREDIHQHTASLLDEAVAALEEARKLVIEANEALLARVVAGEIPNTVYNYERDQRQAYIDRIDATLAKIRSKT